MGMVFDIAGLPDTRQEKQVGSAELCFTLDGVSSEDLSDHRLKVRQCFEFYIAFLIAVLQLHLVPRSVRINVPEVSWTVRLRYSLYFHGISI